MTPRFQFTLARLLVAMGLLGWFVEGSRYPALIAPVCIGVAIGFKISGEEGARYGLCAAFGFIGVIRLILGL